MIQGCVGLVRLTSFPLHQKLLIIKTKEFCHWILAMICLKRIVSNKRIIIIYFFLKTKCGNDYINYVTHFNISVKVLFCIYFTIVRTLKQSKYWDFELFVSNDKNFPRKSTRYRRWCKFSLPCCIFHFFFLRALKRDNGKALI